MAQKCWRRSTNRMLLRTMSQRSDSHDNCTSNNKPKKNNLMKYEFDAAYKRLHINPLKAVKAIRIIEEFAYLLLWLPFGASSGPSKYNSISETIFELTTNILHDEEWDPTKLHSIYCKRLRKPERLQCQQDQKYIMLCK